jgi:lipid A oxidase
MKLISGRVLEQLERRAEVGWSDRLRAVDRAGSALAMMTLAAATGVWMAEENAVEREALAVSRKSVAEPGVSEAAGAETMVAGYLGAPYTYASNVRIVNPAEKTDFTISNVEWEGKPFKSPIYYGVRAVRWGASNRTGVMVDFTHSKTISKPEQEVEFKGMINGAPAPVKAKIGAMFKHLEFSHGHNMLTLNGLFRLANLTPRLSAYVGAGAGVALPHTEVQMRDEAKRSYEYQYTGPVVQGLVGLEFRLAETSLFFEYKFTFADYVAPLTRMDGTWLFADLWREIGMWWRGEKPPGGMLDTRLASHQVIGGVGYRFRQ